MSRSVVTARPQVSVLIPAYNSPPIIVQAVTSALAQTIGDVEVIVSDDGSTQPVAERLAPVRDKLYARAEAKIPKPWLPTL